MTHIVEDGTSGITGSTSPYGVEVIKAWGNLIALDADGSSYDTIEINVASAWTAAEVGTFRMDLDIKTGQTISVDAAIEGADVLDLAEASIAVLLFDKPYGTTTWTVRQP